MSHVFSTKATDNGWAASCTCGARFESTDIDIISTQIAQHEGKR